AFWCATGSGKTLLMHVHVRQFRQYHQRAFSAGIWPKLDQIILVTPNDGLSTQHATEFAQSGFDVVTVGEQGVDGLFAAQARTLHEGILRDVFHAPGGGVLAVQMLRGATGELALKVGEAEPFGVVNVGEPGAVAEACAAKGVVRLEDDANRSSLFQGINRDDSPINLLVGSRKFTEGWNSWRVSS
ncbi:MAG: hypothetical protein ACK5TP_02395, partial [bacterium]